MNDVDELDSMWRDGLASAAADGPQTSDPHARVAERVHRRRRLHAISVGAVVLGVILAAVAGVAVLANHPDHTNGNRIASSPPHTVVEVRDGAGGQLRITFPGRAITGHEVRLPAGVYPFEFHMLSPGHELALDDVPGFAAGRRGRRAVHGHPRRRSPGGSISPALPRSRPHRGRREIPDRGEVSRTTCCRRRRQRRGTRCSASLRTDR